METEPRDLQLLDDEDEGSAEQNNHNTNSSFLNNNSFNGSSIKAYDAVKTYAPQAPINEYNSVDNMHRQSMTLGRPSSFGRFKISPNNPNLNDAKLQELKSIARPRSRSSSRFNSPMNQRSGIEEYIHKYVNGSKASSQTQLNKITMNLKMDDLLASVKNENTSYQMLSNASFLTGDSDAIGAENQMYSIKKGKRTRSLENTNMSDGDWLNDRIRDLNSFKNNNNEKDSDEDEENNNVQDTTNLKYKYTASYRKEDDGSFQEQSRIVFEAKSGAGPILSSGARDRFRKEEANEDDELEDSETGMDLEAKRLAKQQLQAVLDQMRGNSDRLESQLDVIDELHKIVKPHVYDPTVDGHIPDLGHIPIPKSVQKIRANPKISNLESNIETGFTLIKNILGDNNSSSNSAASNMSFPNSNTSIVGSAGGSVVATTGYKKSNDLFFNEFLTKSDDLLAQTQSKLEKLGKLDSIIKPIAPRPVELKPDKPVPRATVRAPVANESITQPSSIIITKQNLTPVTPDINNSASLIDLKSWETGTTDTKIQPSQPPPTQEQSQIDLLFDIGENSLGFELAVTPIKQTGSYCDLIGLQNTTDNVISELQNLQQAVAPFPKELLSLQNSDLPESRSSSSINNAVEFKDTFLNDMIGPLERFDTTAAPAPKVTEILGLYSSVNMAKKNSFYENMLAISEVEEPAVEALFSATEPDPDIHPTIDILITEPVNEMNDSNIVPEDMFDYAHEKPNERSTASSPSFKSISPSPEVSNNSLNNFGVVGDLGNPEIPTQPVNQKPVGTVSRAGGSVSPSIARSRPVVKAAVQVENFETDPPMSEIENSFSAQMSTDAATPAPVRKTNKIKVKSYKASNKPGEPTDFNQHDSTSSSSEDDEQKFQIRIRPKSQRKSVTSATIDSPKCAPLLPKPPKTAQELDEFRQRRLSSGAESMTRSMFGSAASDDSDDDLMKADSGSAEANNQRRSSQKSVPSKSIPRKFSQTRKESVQSEYNLELPDEDDSAPLNDFNEKCELTRYADGSYGCMLLVRQPFPDAKLMYKNMIAKMTEVRTWNECLVKLIDAGPNKKRLAFYNSHELVTLAAERELSLDEVINTMVANTDEIVSKPVPTARDFYRDDTGPVKEDEKTVKVADLPRILPFYEIELKASYKFSELALQQHDVFTKIHTFKIQEIIFKETLTMRQDRLMALPERFMKRFTKPKAGSLIDHTPIPFEIVKFAHVNHAYLRSFLLLLQDVFWQIPTITRKLQREQQLAQINSQPITTVGTITAAASTIFNFGSQKQVAAPSLTSVVSSHAQEQITVKVIDEYLCDLDTNCRILSHRSRTRVFLICFLNAATPTIEIGMNDCLRHGKEIVGRHDIIPIKTEQWISPEIFELNENVLEKEEFQKSHFLKCQNMPDNLLVEIMRYRTRPRRNYELPLQVRCHMSLVGRVCEIRIEATVAGNYFSKLNEQHCSDIQIRFPLPDAWVYMFRVEKMFRYGAVHSTKHKFGKIKGLDRLLVHKTQHQGAIMEASCGTAKYEQAFRSLVWRIEQLPVKNKDIYKTHLFICKMNLQEYDKLPDDYEKISQVQYTVSQICAASKSQVRSISVDTCEDPPEKWVKLKSKFEYNLQINYTFDKSDLPTVDPAQCAELQNLQSESDFDNNEDASDAFTSDKE